MYYNVSDDARADQSVICTVENRVISLRYYVFIYLKISKSGFLPLRLTQRKKNNAESPEYIWSIIYIEREKKGVVARNLRVRSRESHSSCSV